MKNRTCFALLLLALLVVPTAQAAASLDYTQLVSLWRLDAGPADSFGTNNGTFVGQPSFESGPSTGTGAAVFDGNGYLKAGKNVAFETNNAFSATAWIKGPLQNSAIIGRMVQGGAYTGWEFHVGDRSGVLNLWLINQFGPNFIAVHGATTVLDESWHHVAFSYDGSGTAAGVRLYVDGQDDTADAGADSLTGTIVATDAELCVGTRQNGANHTYQGSLAEVSLWKTALTDQQVAAIFQAGVHPPMTFAANASETFAGAPVTLTWEAESGATLKIDQGVGDVTAASVGGKGSVQVSPEMATTYTLTATKGANQQQKQVSVGIKPMIVSFASSAPQVPQGVAVGLSWAVHPQAKITLTPSVGDPGANTTNGVGGLELFPSQTTTYVLKVQRNAEIAEASVTVSVVETGMPDFSKLVSLWRLNDGTTDSVGTNAGIFYGPEEQYTEGPRANSRAVVLDGSSWVAAGMGVAFDTASAFSAAAWINGPLAQDSTIVGRMRQGNGYTGWELHVGTSAGGSGTGKLNVWLINNFGSSFIQVNSPKIVLDDTWHHVAFSYDGSSKASGVRIFVDGLDVTGPATGDNLNATILPEDAELNIGSRQNGANHNFRGSLSEVSVWNSALTLGNVFYLYKQGIPTVLPPSPVRLFGAAFATPSSFRFSWESVAGKSYRVEVSSNLKDWSVASEPYPASGASGTTTTFTATVSNGGTRFYRVAPR